MTTAGLDRWVTAYTDERDLFLADADVAELAAALPVGPSSLRRRTAGGWQVDRAGQQARVLPRVAIAGHEHHQLLQRHLAMGGAAGRPRQAHTPDAADTEDRRCAADRTRPRCRGGADARDLAERWQHSRAVAARAVRLAVTVPPTDRAVLVAAAWLHDMGARRHPGHQLHPLDGGLHLRAVGWDERIVGLVAHHSGARFVSERRGLGLLTRQFEFEDDAVSDALTYADQTVGPWGRPMVVHDRIDEAINRHGPASATARARTARVPYLLAVADRVEQRLSASRPA